MPAGAGTPRYEKPELWLGKANWHGETCYAPSQPQRGTSPRATLTVAGVPGFSINVLPRGHGAWIPAFAGMTKGPA